MTRAEAEAELERRRAAEPGVTWTVTEREDGWRVVRIGLAPAPSRGTATKPPPPGPRENPQAGKPDPNWGVG